MQDKYMTILTDNKILQFAVNLITSIRKRFSKIFDRVDSVVTEFSAIVDEHGPTIIEYTYTTATKLERAVPSHGFGSSKLAMFDAILAEEVIPFLEKLRGKRVSTAAKSAVTAYAKNKLIEFVQERNSKGDWEQYIKDLDVLEAELGIK